MATEPTTDTPVLSSAETHAKVVDKPAVAASANKWAAEAVKALEAGEAKQKAAAAEAGEPAQAERPRDPVTKQFLPTKKGKTDAKPKEAKAAPAAEAVPKPTAPSGDAPTGSDDPAEAASADPAPLAGSLGKVKRLVNEGKIADAFKLIGLDPEKLTGGMWKSWRHENKKKEAELVAASEAIETKRQEFHAEARRLHGDLRHLAQAKDAIDAGDDEAAFKLLWGKSAAEWQREQLMALTKGGAPPKKDPQIAEALAEARAARERAEKLEADLKAERASADAARVQSQFLTDLKGRLADHADERVSAAAEKPWFVKLVRDELRSHYDPHTDTSIPEDEAIELVFDPERLTASQWRELTGGLDPSGQRDPRTSNGAVTDHRGNDAKRAAKPLTSLSRSAAAEATPAVKRDEKASREYWATEGARLASQGKLG